MSSPTEAPVPSTASTTADAKTSTSTVPVAIPSAGSASESSTDPHPEDEHAHTLVHETPHSLAERLAYTPDRVVVIAVDESPNAREALDWAIKNIFRPGHDLSVLLHCREPVAAPIAYDGGLGVGYYDFSEYSTKIEYNNRQRSHQMLKDYAHIVQGNGVKVKAYALRGDAREAIADKAVELQPDLLIVGSRGFGAFKRAFIGSTSDYLVHNLECPVLVVKNKETASHKK